MSKHTIVTGLSAWGFHATCPCGWRTARPSWDREAVARAGNDHICNVLQGDVVVAGDDHKIRQRLRSVP
jgi:hypothetical protein